MRKVAFVIGLILVTLLLTMVASDFSTQPVDRHDNQHPIEPAQLLDVPARPIDATHAKTPTRQPAGKPITELNYQDLTFAERHEVFMNCNGYFLHMSLGIDPLVAQIDLVSRMTGRPMTENQMVAWEQINNNCHRYLEVAPRLVEQTNREYQLSMANGINAFALELIDTMELEGINAAMVSAQANLFHDSSLQRSGALSFLLNRTSWLDSVHQHLGMNQAQDMMPDQLMTQAIELMECELGLIDCSANSFSMLLNCGFDAETCGMSMHEHSLRFSSASDWETIQRYLSYLRNLTGG